LLEAYVLLAHVLIPIALAVAGPSGSGASDTLQQFERWERRLRAKVAKLDILPSTVEKGSTGDVVISFSIGPNGRPNDAVIQQSSGNPLFDRLARRTVRLLGPIGPVPSMAGKDHRVVLKLSYGEAATWVADSEITRALEAERQAYSRRNLAIVTMGSRPTEK